MDFQKIAQEAFEDEIEKISRDISMKRLDMVAKAILKREGPIGPNGIRLGLTPEIQKRSIIRSIKASKSPFHEALAQINIAKKDNPKI